MVNLTSHDLAGTYRFEMIDPRDLDKSRGYLDCVVPDDSDLTFGYYTDLKYQGTLFVTNCAYIENSLIRIFYEVSGGVESNRYELGTFFVATNDAKYSYGRYTGKLQLLSPLCRFTKDKCETDTVLAKGRSAKGWFWSCMQWTGSTGAIAPDIEDKVFDKTQIIEFGKTKLEVLNAIAEYLGAQIGCDNHGRITMTKYVPPSSRPVSHNVPYGDDSITFLGVDYNNGAGEVINRAVVRYKNDRISKKTLDGANWVLHNAHASNLVITALYASGGDGRKLQLLPYVKGDKRQIWVLDDTKNGMYLHNAAYDKVLDVRNAAKDNGTIVQGHTRNASTAQYWEIEEADGDKTGYDYLVLIKPKVDTGMRLTGAEAGETPTIRQADGRASQKWLINDLDEPAVIYGIADLLATSPYSYKQIGRRITESYEIDGMKPHTVGQANARAQRFLDANSKPSATWSFSSFYMPYKIGEVIRFRYKDSDDDSGIDVDGMVSEISYRLTPGCQMDTSIKEVRLRAK